MAMVKKYLLILFSLISFHLHASYLKKIDSGLIEKKAQKIEKSLRFHERVEKFIQGASAVYNVYLVTQIISHIFDSPSVDVKLQKEQLAADQSIDIQLLLKTLVPIDETVGDKIKKIPGSLLQGLLAIPGDLWTVVISGDLFRAIGYTFGNGLMIAFTNFAIQSALNKVSHHHTIKWYVQTHAPYAQTIKLCRDQVAEYRDMEVHRDERQEKEFEMLVKMTNLLLRDIESIVAYMSFRVPTLISKYKRDALLIQELLLHYVQDWQESCDNALQERDMRKIDILFEQCSREVDRLYAMFTLYEKHKKHTSIVRKIFR